MPLKKILKKCMVFDIKMSITPNGDNDTLDESRFLQANRNKESDTLAQLNNLSKDVRYLYRMKELEDATKSTSKLMDAVPVTGLILARMFTLENECRTVLELWEDKLTTSRELTLKLMAESQSQQPGAPQQPYTGFKKFKEGGGDGSIARMLVEGGIIHKHGKRKVWSVAVYVHVTAKMDTLIVGTPSSDVTHSKVTKQIPLMTLINVHIGKSPAFCFYAVDSCCFSLVLSKGASLHFETKTALERDKWVAGFKWLLATRNTKEPTEITLKPKDDGKCISPSVQ